MPHLDELSMQAIATRPGFVAEVKLAGTGLQFLDELSNMIGAVWKGAEGTDFAAANTLGNRH